jgi:hypothetical protein
VLASSLPEGSENSAVGANIVAALDKVREAIADEGHPEEDFHSAADEFLRVFHATLEERGVDVLPLEEWDPRPYLFALEAELVGGDDPDVADAAAVKTIRDSLDAAAEEMASST